MYIIIEEHVLDLLGYIVVGKIAWQGQGSK
jgi:hypothetical protein